MKTITLTLISLLLLFLFTSSIYAGETGVYLTREDFKKGKMIKADEGTLQAKGQYGRVISLKENGVAREFKTSELFAMYDGNNLYRVGPNSLPVGLSAGGDYCLWDYRESQSGGSGQIQLYFLSKGVDGQLVQLNFMPKGGFKKFAEKHPEFAGLNSCVQSEQGMLLWAVEQCIKKSAGYKQNAGDLLKPEKN